MGEMQLQQYQQRHQQRRKIQPKFYHAVCLCKTFLFTAQSSPSRHTHTHTRQQLLADGMEGFYRHMLTVQKPVGSRTVSERSQTERRVGFISPVRSSLPPFHISTASTFLL